MTREEARILLKKTKPKDNNAMSIMLREAMDMAIKALEQESCGDSISRQAILSKIKEVCFSKDWAQFRIDNGSNGQRDFLINYIEQLPSVMPNQRTGRWIEHDFEQLRKMGYYRCSECNIGYQRYERGERKSELSNINGQKYELHRIDNYCPNCGAKMQGVEDK